VSDGRDPARAEATVCTVTEEACMCFAHSGTPSDVLHVQAPRGERVLDGFSRVMHNRWNRDLEPAVIVRPGEEIQLLCRDALDIGDQARTLTADGSRTSTSAASTR